MIAGWQRPLRQVAVVMLLAHLFWLYVALLQLQPGQRLHYYFDAPLWLSLQILLSLSLSGRWYPWLAQRGAAVWLQQTSAILLFASVMLLPQLLIDLWQQLQPAPLLLLKQWLMNAVLQLVIGLLVQYQRTQQQQAHQQQQLAEIKTASSQLQLELLQQQFEPHFLFNNLNVLSALIHKDADDADEFLQQFTAIYRYLWQHKAVPLVSLQAELDFASAYLALLNRRFAGSFQLTLDANVSAAAHLWQLVPGTLQLALENAQKHNHADSHQPLPVRLALDGDRLQISNPLRPKMFAPEHSGFGLQHLAARSLASTGQRLHILPQPPLFILSAPLVASRQPQE